MGRRLAAMLLVAGLATVVSGCGLSSAGTAITAPLVGLKDTDTVVETNLQTAASGQVTGIGVTSGPSSSYTEISEFTSPQASVYAAFNQLSNDCLGIVKVTLPGVPVLGATTPGEYFFWWTNAPPAQCSAASFAQTQKPPNSWATGDPSSTGWPLP